MSRHELETMRDQLSKRVECITIRGEGAASFLFVTNAGKAVEVSAHQDGGWWLELWESSTDEDAPPVLEKRAETSSEVIELMVRWLC